MEQKLFLVRREKREREGDKIGGDKSSRKSSPMIVVTREAWETTRQQLSTIRPPNRNRHESPNLWQKEEDEEGEKGQRTMKAKRLKPRLGDTAEEVGTIARELSSIAVVAANGEAVGEEKANGKRRERASERARGGIFEFRRCCCFWQSSSLRQIDYADFHSVARIQKLGMQILICATAT